MSPVHVLVSADQSEEAAWAQAFSGAIDLYRFPSSMEAIERLTAAAAPIDLVVVTAAQAELYNLTAGQLAGRLLDSSLARSPHLAGVRVVLVGERASFSHERLAEVSSLEAAIRLVKFGEVEAAPRTAAPEAPEAPAAPAPTGGESAFASSVISKIWDAGDRAAAPAAAPAPATAATRVESPAAVGTRGDVSGGGAPRQAQPTRLFERTVQPAAQQAPVQLAPAAHVRQDVASTAGMPVQGGGPNLQSMRLDPAAAARTDEAVDEQVLAAIAATPQAVGAPGEAISVAGDLQLQPAQPYVLPNGAAYRGAATRGGRLNAASHEAMSRQPAPPALAEQVHAFVYGPQGAIADPVLVLSRDLRGSGTVPATQPAPVPAPIPVAAAAAPGPAPVPGPPAPGNPGMPPAGRSPVPAPVAAPAPAPAPAPVASADPLVARAEQDGGVSFG